MLIHTPVRLDPSWERFAQSLRTDVRFFLFFVLLLGMARLGFVLALHRHLGAVTVSDLLVAVRTAIRFDIKSAAMATAVSFVLLTIPAGFCEVPAFSRIRKAWGALLAAVLVFAAHARVGYYQAFKNVWDESLFNFFQDDTVAVVETILADPALLAALISSVFFGWVAVRLLGAWLNDHGRAASAPAAALRETVPRNGRRALLVTAWIGFLASAAYGNFRGNELRAADAAVTGDAFLNLAILDDVTSLRRAYVDHARLQRANHFDISPAQLRRAALRLGGMPSESGNLDAWFTRRATGPHVPAPRHIFVIVGESYARWPLLPQYAALHIADGVKAIVAEADAVEVPNFVPSSSGTMTSLASLLAGMADVGVFTSYQLESKKPYASGLAQPFRNLGYAPRFYYGGFPSWQHLDRFAPAQGFDELYSAGNTREPADIWGVADDRFLKALARDFKDDRPTFNVILTTTNHAPYTLDLPAEGFDREATRRGLPPEQQNNDRLLDGLGHFWYSDRAIAAFVREMRKRYPDSLFVITGDHAQRLHPLAEPSLAEKYSVPLILFGKGIHKGLFEPAAAGSHLNIGPTLIELIAPPGFSYVSLVPSLFESRRAYQHSVWLDGRHIGRLASERWEPLPWARDATAPPVDAQQRAADYDAMIKISWWRIMNGNRVDKVARGP